MLTSLAVHDAISFLLSLLVLSYCLYTIDVIAIVGCFMAVILPMISKYYTSNTDYPEIFKRPDGARDCNLFNTGGICDQESGFPSGHVTLISYFCFYIYSIYKDSVFDSLYGTTDKDEKINTFTVYLKDLSVFVIFALPIIIMGYARYMKKCHNFVQVLAGAITGYIISKTIVHCQKNKTSKN